VYKLRGKVVSTDAAKGEVTLNHEAIPRLHGRHDHALQAEGRERS
jgi:hypothetical protein